MTPLAMSAQGATRGEVVGEHPHGLRMHLRGDEPRGRLFGGVVEVGAVRTEEVRVLVPVLGDHVAEGGRPALSEERRPGEERASDGDNCEHVVLFDQGSRLGLVVGGAGAVVLLVLDVYLAPVNAPLRVDQVEVSLGPIDDLTETRSKRTGRRGERSDVDRIGSDAGARLRAWADPLSGLSVVCVTALAFPQAASA